LPVIKETRVFTDPAQPTVELELTFTVPPDIGLSTLGIERGTHYAKLYLQGKDGGPPAPLPPIGNPPRVPILSEGILTAVAYLELLDTPENPEDRYDFLDWIALSVNMPNAFTEISEWMNELMQKARHERKNS
jgi:hypothetical protein